MQPKKEETVKPTGYAYVRRTKDGVVLDIPLKHLQKTLKRLLPDGRLAFEYVGEVRVATGRVEVPIVEESTPESAGMHCPLCGFEAKNERSLKMHKTKSHA